ncbi:MAG: hypothetical protein JW866_07710 [Ignavibacteriales bacterium]|nr:hypothetical protein [Ignavibacteriales bacterium]
MKKGKCPKCGSSNIYEGTKVKMKGGSHGSNSIPITSWSAAPLDNYVCIDCGYVESYIANKEKLEKIKEKWPKFGLNFNQNEFNNFGR